MATLNDEILQAVRKTPGLTDRELTNVLRGRRAPQQPINQAARMLERKGILVRKRRGDDNLIGNFPCDSNGAQATSRPSAVIKNHDVDALSEDEVKKALNAWLKADGWETKIAWGNDRGIDIDARRGSERWIIEVKGPGSRQPMRVNYFIGILGETLQRMSDPGASYSIAFPDVEQYRRLWKRLPQLAKSRTKISLLLVSKTGRVEQLSR